MNLCAALGVNRGSRIAIVGSGGKTTAMFQIASELQPPVIVTTTTHLGGWQSGLADSHMTITGIGQIPSLMEQIVDGLALVTQSLDYSGRLGGLDTNLMMELYGVADRLECPVIIEADGSRGKPLKAPAANEPAIPLGVNHVIVVVGASAIGKPLGDEFVHRSEIFGSLCGISVGESIGLDALVRYLLHREGGLKNIPEHVKKSVIINQLDSGDGLLILMRVANILTKKYDSITLCSLLKKTTWATITR